VIDYYTAKSLGGNTRKVSIMLAETQLDHVVHFVDLAKNEQHEDWYVAINPNARIPAIVDHDLPGGLALGESGAILVHLAEKTARFLPTEPGRRARVLQWTFWQVGAVGPMAGQLAWFKRSAPQQIPFAIERYEAECARLLGVLDRQLGRFEYVAGDEYSIADMMNYSWILPLAAYFQAKALEHGEQSFANVARWLTAVRARPAVELAMTRFEGAARRVGRDVERPLE